MNLSQFEKIKIYDYPHDLQTHLVLDLELEQENKDNELTVRYWLSKGVVFGKMDTLLRDFLKGEEMINQKGYPTIVRKAGGLAIPLDEGTLNMTFIFNKTNNLLDAYELVSSWMIDFFALYEIEVEICETPHSYCPGKYDLVYKGQKFCGIAQIRTKESVIVMLNLVLEGNQKARLKLMKQFYEMANPFQNPRYPQIELDSMIALDMFSVDQFKQHFNSYLRRVNRCIEVLDKK